MVVFLNWFPLRTYYFYQVGQTIMTTKTTDYIYILYNYTKSPSNLLIFILLLHIVIFKIFQDVNVGIRLIQLTSTK